MLDMTMRVCLTRNDSAMWMCFAWSHSVDPGYDATISLCCHNHRSSVPVKWPSQTGIIEWIPLTIISSRICGSKLRGKKSSPVWLVWDWLMVLSDRRVDFESFVPVHCQSVTASYLERSNSSRSSVAMVSCRSAAAEVLLYMFECQGLPAGSSVLVPAKYDTNSEQKLTLISNHRSPPHRIGIGCPIENYLERIIVSHGYFNVRCEKMHWRRSIFARSHWIL